MNPPTSLPLSLHLVLTSEPEAVRHCADALCKLLLSGGCDTQAAAEIELCVVEAMNNIIEHAYGTREGRPFELLVGWDAEGLVIELKDQGKSLPDGALERAVLPEVNPDDLASLPEGGWGLYLLHELMDEVSYEVLPGGNRMRLVRRRHLTDSK